MNRLFYQRLFYLLFIIPAIFLGCMGEIKQKETNPGYLQESITDHSERIPEDSLHLQWIHDQQVILGMVGMPYSDVDYRKLVMNLNPDFNDWTPAPHIEPLLSYGIRSTESVGGFSKAQQKSSVAKKYKDAMCLTARGEPATATTAWGTKFIMCHNDPDWHAYKKKEILDMLSTGVSGMNQDLVNVMRSQPGFCEDCQREFRNFMKANFTDKEMREMGIQDIDNFNIVEYLKDEELGDHLTKDPIVRQYILSLNLSQRDKWRDIVETVHAQSGKYDRTFAMTGNLQLGERIYGSLLSEVSDIVSDEEDPMYDEYEYPRPETKSAKYKFELASGRYKKPVWLRGGLFDRERKAADGHTYRMRLYGQVFQDLAYGEAFANGVVRVFNLGNEGAPPPEPDHEHREPFYRRFIDYSNLIHSHRAAFLDRENGGEVGLVYSMATQIWEEFKPFEITIENHYERFLGWGRVLEELHLPYEVVIFGHSKAFPDKGMLDRLARYKILIVPGVECMSERQAEAIKEFVENGGTLVYSGSIGIYDEDRYPRDESLFSDYPRLLREHIGDGKVVGILDNDLTYHNSIILGVVPEWGEKGYIEVSSGEAINPTDFHAMREAVMWGLDGDPQIVSTATPDVQFNIWVADNSRSASLHMVNYKVDLMRDYVEPLRDFEVSLRVPDQLNHFDRLILLRPGEKDRELSFELVKGRVVFKVPELTVWGIIIFSSGLEHEASSVLANCRKEIHRHAVLEDMDIEPLVKRYKDIFSLYAGGYYDKALSVGRELLTDATPPWLK